jgi:hypothetical protein
VSEKYDLQEMVAKVKAIRKNAAELKSISCGIQAVDRNVDRILANVKMLEINLTDIADILESKG